MGDFGDNDSIRNINVLGGGAVSELGTAMAILGSIINPLSNQIKMNAERPNFQETAENFLEFRRKWKEYHRLIKGNSPTTNEGQILHLFQQCFDKAKALQLKREIQEKPHLTVANFMAIMEKDFGNVFLPKPGTSGHRSN